MHLSDLSSPIWLFSFLLSFSLSLSWVRATPKERTGRGNVPSAPEQNHGATCSVSTGDLDYYDCLKTIWTMPGDRDQASYKGEQILFPPAGIDCAIAIFPFPVPSGGKVDFTSWQRLKINGAAKIAAECQRGKDPGVGGFDYGFGVNGNTGMLLFKMPRPASAAPNSLAYLPSHSWDTLYHYVYALVYPDSQTADPNEAGSSSAGPGTEGNNAHMMSQIIPEWYDPEAPPPSLGSESNSISPLVNQQQPANELGTFPGGSVAMVAFEQEHPGQQSETCGMGYCLTGADCNGCGECFGMAHDTAMSILFGIARFFASVGRCLTGVEGGIAGSGSGGSGLRKRRVI